MNSLHQGQELLETIPKFRALQGRKKDTFHEDTFLELLERPPEVNCPVWTASAKSIKTFVSQVYGWLFRTSHISRSNVRSHGFRCKLPLELQTPSSDPGRSASGRASGSHHRQRCLELHRWLYVGFCRDACLYSSNLEWGTWNPAQNHR